MVFSSIKSFLTIGVIFICVHAAQSQKVNLPSFQNTSLSIETRADSLLAHLTIEEKIHLLGYQNNGVPRLGVPAYNWWNEALHGVARAGKATVFPQAIGMASSFNPILLEEVATCISTEGRAKYNLSHKENPGKQYVGLTYWSPNINIFRDPRWGRGQETYGEDPYLTGQMGSAFVLGLQGRDSQYLKTAACAKHFAVHSGPEALRHSFNAKVDEKDLRETYVYAFHKLVQTKVEAVMCAYNRLNGEPCCTNNFLLYSLLRSEYGFRGHIVTDCWALEDIRSGHKIETDGALIAAKALKAGVNLDCSKHLQSELKTALERGLVTEADINNALRPLLITQLKLGFYNKEENNPYKTFEADSIGNTYHKQVAKQMARESMVLLKNNGVLPLSLAKNQSLMVLGPNATTADALMANYRGVSGEYVTYLEGITQKINPQTIIDYDQGFDMYDTTHFGGIWAAGNTDISIVFLGFTPAQEGEDGDAFLSSTGGDKLTSLSLPASQLAFLRKLRKTYPNKQIITVITAGSAIDLTELSALSDALIMAWYPGEQGGAAFADILFGAYSPSGRLPVTVYKHVDDLPAFDSYAMEGRTYRYSHKTSSYPFGFGLSYASFQYQWIQTPRLYHDSIQFTLEVKNESLIDAQEVAQIYVAYPNLERMPIKELKAFQKKEIKAGKSLVLHFSIPLIELKKWDLQKQQWKLYPGKYQIMVGQSAGKMLLQQTLPIK
jgi:beta-glucosidase